MMKTLHLTLTGTRPLVLHNGRLANPLDPHSRAIAAIAKKRNKTDKDYAQLAALESRGAMYEAPGDQLGLPEENIWKSLYEAGKAYKLGEAIKRALHRSDAVIPLRIGGRTHHCDTYIGEDPERLFYRSVVVNRKRSMRARPMVPAGWQCAVVFPLDTAVLDANKLKPVIDHAGLYVGLAEWRPKFGLFTADASVDDA